MLENEDGVRERSRQPGAVRHLARENLQFEQQPVIGKHRQPATPVLVVHDIGTRREAILRILMPMQLLSDTPGCRQLRQTSDQCAGIGIAEIGVGDIGVRPAGGVRETD